MKKAIIISLAAILLAGFSKESSATHLAGGQIGYVYAGNNGLDYDVTFTFYRDCAGLAGALPTFDAVITASSANAGVSFNTTTAPGINLGEVVPLCPTATSTCTVGFTEGRARWDYTITISLPSKEIDWVFSAEYNARNGAITTGPSGPMYVYSTLNNTIFPYNNAPFFANDPAAFIYVNEAFCFNNGSVDIDGDSLAYSLISPLNNATTPVTYLPAYSATQPVLSTPAVTIDPSTGDVCMLPTSTDVTVMAILVEEYRGGVLIGSVERDIQVSVLTGPDALPSMTGINGTSVFFDTIPEGCDFIFTVNSADTDLGQCVTMTTTAAFVPFFNSFTTTGGCPSLVRPTGTFDFTPGGIDVRNQPYCFTVTVRDDFCPIEGQQVRAFCLYVIDFTADFTSSAPACVGEGVNFYSVQPFKPSYRYNWDFGAGAVSSLAQDTAANPVAVTYTTSGAKSVQLTITGPGGCSVNTTNVITIHPTLTAGFTTTGKTMSKCQGDTVSFTPDTTVLGASHSWDFGLLAFPAGSSVDYPSPTIYLGDGAKTATHTITSQYGCVSTDTVNFSINSTPTASFSSNAPSCTGQLVDFVNTGTSGASNYAWTFGSGATPATMSGATENPSGITYTATGADIKTVSLVVTTTAGCTDSIATTINVYETPAPSFTHDGPACADYEIVNFLYGGTTGTGWTYDWDFGLAAFPSSSSSENPAPVVYLGPVTQNVNLTVTNGMCSDTTSMSLTINETPVANFSSNTPSCTGDLVDFSNTGSSGGPTYVWDFDVMGTSATPTSSTTESPTGVMYDTSGSGTKYVLLETTLGSCIDSSIQTINLTDRPIPSFTHNAPQCEGATVTFTYGGSMGTGWTYDWDFGMGATPSSSSSPNPPGVTYSGAGSKTVMVTVSNGLCSDSITSTFTIDQTPMVSFTSNAPACTGDSVDFVNTGTNGASYAWNFGIGGTPGTSTAENPTGVTFTTMGLNAIKLVTTIAGCSDSVTNNITLMQTPAPSFTAIPNTCEGDDINFAYTGTSDTNWTYVWDFGAGATPAGSFVQNPMGVSYSGAGTKTVSVTVSNGTCSETFNQTHTIMETPMVSFTSNAPACTGDSVDFVNTGTTSASYAWNFGTGGTPGTSSAENPTGVTFTTMGLNAIKLVTTIGTCSDSVTNNITLMQTPAPSFTAIPNTCEGDDINFAYTGTSDTNWTYVWDFGAGATPAGSFVQNPMGVSYSGAGTKAVSVTVSNGTCSETFNQTHTIMETPMASMTSTAPSCTGDSVDFTNTGSTGGSWTYSWAFGSGASPATDTAENPMDVIYATEGTKMITLIVTDGNCSDTSMSTININLRPSVSFQSTAPECAGVGVNFDNTGTSGTTWSYAWDFSGNATPSTSSAELPTGIVFNVGGDHWVSLTISDQNCSETFANTVTIDTVPISNAGLDTTICADQSVTIGSANVANITYSWFPSGTLNNGSISNPTASPDAPITNYVVTVTDTNGCMSSDSVKVTMLTSAIVNAGADVEICFGDTVQIGLGLIDGQTYQWSPPTGLDNPAIPNPMANPTITTTYTVSVSFNNCPPLSDDVLAIVHPLPDAKATDYLLNDTAAITVGGSVQLIATGGVQYQWLPATGLSNPGIFNPVASPLVTTDYVAWVTDIFGCLNTDTVRVKVDSIIFFIPTAFTPDENGFNDIFKVRIEDMTEFTLVVFDRWGEQIFISRSASMGWDGRMQKSGKKLPQGAYVYSFKGMTIKDEVVEQSGIINLIR